MPDISIKDNLDLDIEVKPGDASGIVKYFKSALQLLNPDGKLRHYAPLSLADPAFTSLHADLNAARPLTIAADDISLTIKAGISGRVDVFVPDPHLEPGQTDSLFSPDKYGEDVPVKPTERYVSAGFVASAGPTVSAGVSDVNFGFAADSSLTLTNYQKFSIQPEAPTFLDAIKTTLGSFQIPASVSDLAAMLPDSIITVAGSGTLKFSASANLLAVSNPLATAELPGPFGEIRVSDGASFQVGASFRLFGDYEIRVRKTSETTVRLGYFKEHGKEWNATAKLSAGLSLSLGGDDIFAQIISALSPDAESDFKELKQANVDANTIASIQVTVEAAIERTLDIATSYQVGTLYASQAAFLYDVDLSALDQKGEKAIQAALRGDLSGLVTVEDSSPSGIKPVQSIFTNLRQSKRTFRVNLLGIYNSISLSKLVTKGKVLYDPESGELILSDTATATQLQEGVVNVGGTPNHADPKQVRRILASSLLLTAAYRASGSIVTPPALKSSHTYCELHDQTNRDTMADELGVAVGLGLMTRAEQSDLIQSATQFGRTIAYASADYNDSLATGLFLDNGGPRGQAEYENTGRAAMQVVATRGGGVADPVRLRPLQNDSLWRSMKDGGQTRFRTLLPDATALQMGLVTADYSTIIWWATTMNETGQALMNVRNFLVRNPAVDSQNGEFQKLRSDLAQYLKRVAVDTKEEFGRPWGLIAMDLLTGNRSEARATFTGSVISLTRVRPFAVAAAGARPAI